MPHRIAIQTDTEVEEPALGSFVLAAACAQLSLPSPLCSLSDPWPSPGDALAAGDPRTARA